MAPDVAPVFARADFGHAGSLMDAYQEAVVAWALACLRGKEGAARGRVDKKAGGRPIETVAERFALDGLERRVVELLYAAERSIEVSREARARGGLTVEVVREALGDARVDAVTRPGATLRQRGLVAVDDGWLGGARSGIALAPGLARRLDGEPLDASHLGPAARLVLPSEHLADRFPPTARLAELLRDYARTGVLTVEGCGRREAWALAALAVRTLDRAALVVDGEALAPIDPARGAAWTLLAAARRDADLDGALLIVVQAAALGEAWRAAAVAAPRGASPFVVLADAARPREPIPDEGLPCWSVVLPPLAAAPPAAVTVTAPPKKEDDGFDHIRAQAIRDAERALGIVRREPPKAPIPPPARPAAPVAAPQPTASVAAPPVVAPPVAAPQPTAPVAAQAVTAPPAAAASAPASQEAAKPKRRSKKGSLHFGDPSTQAAAPTADAPTAATPTATAPTATDAITAAAPPPASAAASGPPPPLVEIPAEASPDVLARIAATCPNPDQRIEVIHRLAGHRNSAVIAALRANTRSEHAGVRAAAEAVMASLFGPEWNRSRPIAKPVQAPVTDDKDRGPPGGP
jgi:hypothetical protein